MLLLPDPDTAFLDPACNIPTLSKFSTWESAKGSGMNVFGKAVIVTDEQIADLRRRLARLRGDDVSDG